MKTIPFDPTNAKLVAAVRRIPAFTPLPDSLLNDVMTLASIRDYDRRENIITQGEEDRCLYFLIKGRAAVQIDETVIAGLTKPNTLFGEMGIIDEAPRSASVVARAPTRCLVIDASLFSNLEGRAKLAVQAFFYKMFYQILVERLRDADEYIADLDMQKVVLETMDID